MNNYNKNRNKKLYETQSQGIIKKMDGLEFEAQQIYICRKVRNIELIF